MKHTKIICMMLAALMLITAVGCGENGAAQEENTSAPDAETTASVAAETTSAETGREDVKDGLPELNFNGREFRTLVQSIYKTDITVPDDGAGEIVASAVYARNQTVNERLGVVIAETTASDYKTMSDKISNLVKSGTYEYDLVMQHMIQAGNDALGDNFVDWYTVPYVDFTREWYPQFAIEGLSVNGKMLITIGDMLLAGIDRIYCIFYDKNDAQELGCGDIAKIALEGGLTIDKLTECTANAYRDLNGDSKVDTADYFGFASDCLNGYSAFIYSLDLDRVEIDSDYKAILHYNDTDKTENAIEKLKALMLRDSTYCWLKNGDASYVDMFMNGTVAFIGGTLGTALTTIRGRDGDYGILPYPKYDNDQENYYTIMGGGVSTMEVLRTVTSKEDLEFIGAVTECMCSETWRSVIPQYYEVALKYKATRDLESLELMDIIVDSRAVDVGLAYDGWAGFNYTFNAYIHGGASWSVKYKQTNKIVAKHYQQVADIYAKLGS